MPKQRGFTLIELLVVISIIAILSLIGITVLSGVQKTARDAKRRSDVDAIAKALEIYRSQNNYYTPATTSCPTHPAGNWNFLSPTWGAEGTNTGCGSSIKNALSSSFAGSIPRDPFCSGSTCSSSWSDYHLITTLNGESFTIYAKLENPPSSPCTYTYETYSYNYCKKSQQ